MAQLLFFPPVRMEALVSLTPYPDVARSTSKKALTGLCGLKHANGFFVSKPFSTNNLMICNGNTKLGRIVWVMHHQPHQHDIAALSWCVSVLPPRASDEKLAINQGKKILAR